jgi:hypothetical protein
MDVWETLKCLKEEVLISDLVEFETDWPHDHVALIKAISKSGSFQDGTQELLKIYEEVVKQALYPYETPPKNFAEEMIRLVVGSEYSRRNDLHFNLREWPRNQKNIFFYIPTRVRSNLTWETVGYIMKISEICVDSDRNEKAGVLDEILTTISCGILDPKADHKELLELIEVNRDK